MQNRNEYPPQQWPNSADASMPAAISFDGMQMPQDYYGMPGAAPTQAYYAGPNGMPGMEYMQPPFPQEMYGGNPPMYPMQNPYSQDPAAMNGMQGYYQQPLYPQGMPAPGYEGAQPTAAGQYGQPQPPAQEAPKKEKKKLFQKKPKPPKEKREKKPSRPPSPRKIITIVLLLLAVVLVGMAVGYFGFGIGKKTTARVETGVYENNYGGDVLLVRDETVYSDESVQEIDYVAQEGTMVNRGNVICYVYSTNFTTKEAITLQSYRDTIRDYENTLLSKETSYDAKMSQLETQLVETALQIRQLIHGGKGNLLNQETALADAIDERQDYFKAKYPSDTTLTRNFDNETTQQQKIDSWIQSKTAMQDGIISFYTDGFEDELSPALYAEYTPSQVKRMLAGEHLNTTAASRGRTNLYRVVQDGNYVVLMLMNDTNFEPHEGMTYKLILEQFGNQPLDAMVISYTRAGGDLLLRLAVMGDVKDVLYLRTCKATLSENTDCVIVPQSALYRKDNIQGVVMLVEGQQWFVPVTVLHRENGKAYVNPVQPGILTDGAIVKLY